MDVRDTNKNRSRPSKILGRSLEVLRNEGLKSFLFKVLGEILYRRLILVERALGEPQPFFRPVRDVVVEVLSWKDVSEYLEFRPDSKSKEIERRLGMGQDCFAVFLGQKIVHAAWVTPGRAFVPYLGIHIEPCPGEFYLFDIYTKPKFRGMNLYLYREREMEKELRRRGCRRVIASVYPENMPALKAMRKSGYRVAGKMGFLRLGPFRHDFFSRDGGPISPVDLHF